MIFRSVLGLLSPSGNRARLSILIFHRVLADPDPLFPGEVCARQFDDICSWIKQWFNVLPLDEAAASLAAGTLPARSAAITFDDGYADNQAVALPILQRHGLPATFYIATGFLNGGRMWNDSVIEAIRRSALPALDLGGTIAAELGCLDLSTVVLRRAAIDRVISAVKYRVPEERQDWVHAVAERAAAVLPDDLMMTSAQVKGLHAAGMQIGAHTVSHPILARLPRAAAEREIAASKDTLEGLLGERVSQFAYPNGKPGEDYSDESVELVKRLGFDAAVSTAWGAARSGGASDRFQIPRFTPWDRTHLRFGARMLHNLWTS